MGKQNVDTSDQPTAALQIFRSGVFKLSQANVSGEAQLVKLLQQRFPQAKTLQVQDISGGCGAMYEISIEAPEFRGLNTVKQHRLVTETLKAQIKEMHGLRIHT